MQRYWEKWEFWVAVTPKSVWLVAAKEKYWGGVGDRGRKEYQLEFRKAYLRLGLYLAAF